MIWKRGFVMKLNLGSKDGKNNRRLLFLNRKRKKNLEIIDENKKQKNNEKETKINEQEIILISKYNVHEKNHRNVKNKGKKHKEDVVSENTNFKQELSIEKNNAIKKINGHNVKELEQNITDVDYLEKQIIKILEQQIDENRYQLRKMDNELYIIGKEIDDLDEKEDIVLLTKEIETLIEKLKYIKRQIESLRKTFAFDFPIEEPDNYLIYLVDEFKEQRKNYQLLNDRLKENQEYKNIIDRISEIELKQEELLEKIRVKEEQLDLTGQKVHQFYH